MGLINGSLVSVKFIKEKAPECHRCNLTLIEPKGIGIDSYRDEMTNNILDQIRVIYPDLVFPFWTSSNDVFFFKVTQINPSVGFSVLVKDSLVEIGHDINESSKVSSVAYKFMGLIPFFNAPKHEAEDAVDSVIVNSIQCKNIDDSVLKTILNVSSAPCNLEVNSTLNTIWVNSSQFNLSKDEYGVLIVNKLLPPCEKAKRNELKKNTDICKRIDTIDSSEEDLFLGTYTLVRGHSECPMSCAFVSDNLRKQLDLSFNCKIFFRRHKSRHFVNSDNSCLTIPTKETFYVCPISVQTTSSPELIRNSLKSYVSKHKILILCRGSCIDIGGQNFIVACDPEDSCSPINEKLLEKIDIRVKSTSFSRISTSWGKRVPLMKLPELNDKEMQSDQLTVYLPYPFIPWMEKELASAVEFLDRILIPDGSIKENTSFARNVLLVHGPKGSGKTCFLKHVMELTSKKYPCVFIKTIQCGSWKTISSLKKQWITQIAECIYSQPSVLIFEGLDLVAPHISRVEEVPGVDTIASIRASCIFSSIIKSFDELNIRFGQRIAIVATCTSQSSLNQILLPIRGRSIFSESISLENPNSEQRKRIIQSFLNHHVNLISSYSWLDQISYRCEGYLIADLLNLVDSAIHNKVTLNQSDEIGLENFEHALQLFRPTMMTDIRIEKSTGISFRDIGGLTKVKNLLRNTLLLPLKYPTLFSKCPIRPPRNILLYGAPGTGKSLIAEALASESRVNLIKIRGPELLSKYIGRSEESIRELFERAAIAKPCIIFFDEFESLAPRRGQDSTGVTDRVVNQLLAQMDGVEVIEQGVYAIAATSRPDLLDPALLRPGRFDKYICCDFPSTADRLDIWKVLGKDLSFHESFNHEIIGELTENFTGADIRALLINSQYEAIEEHETKCIPNLPNGVMKITINEDHVLSATTKTKPCIDSGKRAEYRYM